MILKIDTSKKELIRIIIEKNSKVFILKEKNVDYNQAELLLFFINDILEENNVNLSEIDKIQVENRGDSFTALRIGIITANALAYALGINIQDFKGKNSVFSGDEKKISFVIPEYSKEPSITITKTNK